MRWRVSPAACSSRTRVLSLDLGHSYLLLAFNSVIVGGLGSVRGAFLAALILGLFESFNSVLLPSMPGTISYAVLIAVILWKPDRPVS